MSFILHLEEKYDILTVLSESEKNVVLKARSKANGEQVVIRTIFNAEADILTSLPHINNPYISQVSDVIQDESDVIVIEKLIEGVTLRQTLDDGEEFTETEIQAVFMHLCQALSAIHREGIIHRDIKPSNIIIRDKTAVLIDFDVARQYNPQQSEDTVYMGTKGYAAPEQYGFSQTDSRSDIYSLGIVMKELLGSRFPASAYRDVIEKCTRFDPENRYQTADEIWAELHGLSLESSVGPLASQPVPKRRRVGTVFKIAAGISACLFLFALIYFLSSGFTSQKADERTLETFKNAYKEAGIVLKNEDVPFFRLIGAENGTIFYIDEQKVAIYEFKTEKSLKRNFFISNWPSNGRFSLETSNEEAIRIFNSVAE